jgi:DNA modification methylase
LAERKREMTYQILKGNSLDLLPTLADNSIDAIVTDPPYGLGNPDPDYIIKAIQLWASGDRAHIPEGKGFMGKSWDSFVPPPAIWDECLRVLKPGGHLLAFAGTRTYDLMGISIRMAGFEIRDSIGWVYGSGFPKSLDVSKAIDKNNGRKFEDTFALGKHIRERREAVGLSRVEVNSWFGYKSGIQHWEAQDLNNAQPPTQVDYLILKERLGLSDEFDQLVARIEAEREIVGEKKNAMAGWNMDGTTKFVDRDITAPSTPEAQQWQGWGTALKPALEPIVVARKPLIGTVAENVLTYGTGGLNIDASRIGIDPNDKNGFRSGVYSAKNESNSSWEVKENGSDYVKEQHPQGRWPANLILSHAESCQPTGKTIKSKTGAGKRTATFGTQDTQSGGDGSGGWSGYEYETEVYECVEGCPVKTLDEQSGTSKSPKPYAAEGYKETSMFGVGGVNHAKEFGDSGGASRFFYVAKASKRDRNEGLEHLPLEQVAFGGHGNNEPDGMTQQLVHAPRQNFHPTVKPTALMQYLVKLVTPPGGTVLDPFTGSGSTGKAAILEGFDFIGIELTEDYWPIIEGRLKHAEAKVAEAKENLEAQPQGLF